MLGVAQATKEPLMVESKGLPKDEFVQDIEETPDVSITEGARMRAANNDPVDSFWFFELDTPKPVVNNKTMVDLSHMGATATIESPPNIPDLHNMPDVPIAAPGTFQLFMPDPDMMDRLGTETVTRPILKVPEPDPEPSESSDASISDESRRRSTRSRSKSAHRSVVFADNPVSGSQSPPRPARGTSQTRIVSYQRPPPRERSKSRNTRIARAQQPVNATYTERKTLENLTASMRSASELLERRRSEGSSRYVDHYPTQPNPFEGRGRAPTRSSQASSNIYRSSGTADATSGGGLWGLFDMAQSWLTSHKSRRDRSEEVSRSLIRKSRNHV